MSSDFRRTGVLLVLSAPSGAGKTTLLEALRRCEDFDFSVSCTTRKPRPDERDGIDYHFLDEAEFERRVQAGEFLEHERVHSHRYGTLLRPVIESLARGRDMLMDIDTAGAASLRRCNHPAVSAALADVFLLPPPAAELRKRLERRGTESPEEIEARLSNAAKEAARWQEFRYAIAPGTVESSLAALRAILAAERCRTARMSPAPALENP